MGTDIAGIIEVRPWPDLPEGVPWEPAIRLDLLNVTRDYDAFGCLFGVRNYAGFRPLAAGRGLPEDASEPTRQAFARTDQGSGIGQQPSWISWSEITAIDWDEPALRPDEGLHEYARDQDGQWRLRAKALHSQHSLEALGLPSPPVGVDASEWPATGSWTIGERQFRVGRLTRRDAIRPDGPWQPVWQTMRLLAGLHGGFCRLVVWFED